MISAKLKKFFAPPYTDLYLVALGFGLLSLLFKTSYLLIGSGVALAAILHPISADIATKIWKKTGKFVGWVNSQVLLTALFFAFIAPLAFIYRFSRKKKQKAASEWKTTEAKGTDFTKPW